MLARLLNSLRFAARGANPRFDPASLPALPSDEIAHLFATVEGLPQVDWDMADAWIAHRASPSGESPSLLRRAIAAAWLDQLRDALATSSNRWQHASVEGLAPVALQPRLAAASDRSMAIIGQALIELRGDPRRHPIPPIAVVALKTPDEYYSFVSHFYADGGEYATSGGLYIHGSSDSFPLLVVNAQTQHSLESTVAHELTHHAIAIEGGSGSSTLPRWAEEGLTQMMEEHVTRSTTFTFTRELVHRHRVLWDHLGLGAFLDGESFYSPDDDHQELSYNLAEALTRSLMSTHRRGFYAFARACRTNGADPDDAAREHFGASQEELIERLLAATR